MLLRVYTLLALLALLISPTSAEVSLKVGAGFAAKDSLDCSHENNADAAECLAGLRWEPGAFEVKCEPAQKDRGDWLIRFPSPVPIGDETNDLVAMEWLLAKDAEGRPVKAPAVVVVHESGRSMPAGLAFARGLRGKGLHTFLVHLPGYGARTSERSGGIRKMLPALRQAIADVRRSRDAVSVLPLIEPGRIGVLGISLGGFVTSTVCGLDRGFDHNFVLLAGGNLADVLLHGAKDAARLRADAQKAGVTPDQIRELTRVIEPMRLACRVDAARTWLFSGSFDEVVPPRCSVAFAKAAGLIDGHHQQLPAGHYTAAAFIPVILDKVAQVMLTPAAQTN